MSKYNNLDGLGYNNDLETRIKRIEEEIFTAACERVTDEQIEEWLAGNELEMTLENIESAVTDIAFHKLGWIDNN